METSIAKPKILGSTSINGIDRISSLPDDVLHNILSHLFIFDVVQLSLLSKRWQYIWTTLPYLHFDVFKFCCQRVEGPCDWEMIEKFKYFINWVFISQTATKLVRFRLCCQHLLFDKVAILRWIHAATRRNVQELVLEFHLAEPFELPYCLATCESLLVLKLHLSGNILKLPNHLGFRQLKLLHLEGVELSDEHLTNSLFSKCHLLEKLILQDCSLGAVTLLDIASTSLIYITLGIIDNIERSYACVVKISCPNLKFFKYCAPVVTDIIMENLSSIEAVSINFSDDPSSDEEFGVLVHKMIKEVTSTSVLKLCFLCLSGLYHAAVKVKLSPSSFYKLKSLQLNVAVDEDFMHVMMLLLKSSPNLEVLKLCSDENNGWSENLQLHDPDESIVCLESHLKSIQLTDFKDEENERELIRFFLKNARVLEKVTIVWASYARKSEETPKDVLKFPRTSSNIVLTFLDPKRKPGFLNWYDRC